LKLERLLAESVSFVDKEVDLLATLEDTLYKQSISSTGEEGRASEPMLSTITFFTLSICPWTLEMLSTGGLWL
jgi:hypothetical protein